MNDKLKTKEVRVTTTDNPFNPFSQWAEWLLFDVNAGYNTCGRLDNSTFTSDSMIDDEIIEEVNNGIDILIQTGAINKKGEIIEYVKVYK